MRHHQRNKIMLLILIFIVQVVISCDLTCSKIGGEYQDDTGKLDASIEVKENKKETKQKESDTVSKTIEDYILNCDAIEFWEGSIQGSGSTEVYVLGECYNGESSYDVVLVPNRVYENALNTFNSNKNRWYDYFTAFVFFVGKKESENPENEFDKYEYIFPSDVKVIKSSKTREWVDVGSSCISSFEELGRFKITSIEE